MRSSNIISALTATLIPTILACINHMPSNMSNSTDSPLTIGNDGPADQATLGYNINHVAINTNDLDASMHFYGTVLGMRHIFTFRISPILELVYMGFSAGGKNGTQFQTGEELYRQKDNSAGLVEILYRKPACNDTAPLDPLPASTRVPNTLSHIGLIVPDMETTQERMKAFNVTILKEIGEDPSYKGPLANAFGVGDVSQEEGDAIVKGLEFIGFKFGLVVEDPDGNIVEILPQV